MLCFYCFSASCIFYGTLCFRLLMEKGLTPNPLESPCIHLNSVSQPLSQKVFFFPSQKTLQSSFCTVKKQKLFHLHCKRKQCSWERGIFADVEPHCILPTGLTGWASEDWQISHKVTFEHFGKWFRLFSGLFRCNSKVFGGLVPTSYKAKIAVNLMFWCFLKEERNTFYMVTSFWKMCVYF